MKINVYDFDGTIYDGDSSIDFYCFYIKKNKKELFHMIKILLSLIEYKRRITTMEEVKEEFFSFLKKVPNPDSFIEDFWNHNQKKIKPFFEPDKEENIYIISASPKGLLEGITKKWNVNLIATEVDLKTGKLLSKNCKGKEKVERLKKELENFEIENMYTDSYSDQPLIDLSQNAYLVKKNKIQKIK